MTTSHIDAVPGYLTGEHDGRAPAAARPMVRDTAVHRSLDLHGEPT